MGTTKPCAVTLTQQQIVALIEAAEHELTRLNLQKYEVGVDGVTHYDERMIGIRMRERLLRNGIERLEAAKEGRQS